MFRIITAVLAIMLATIMPGRVDAASVSPMLVNITPSGSGSVARIELANPGNNTFPVEVQMFRGEISEAGELQLTPADADFLVFPTQTIVAAGAQQVFRVQYIGDPELATSQIYYMQIRQIPVPVTPGQNQVRIVVTFNALVNVVPTGTAPRPVIISAQPAEHDGAHGIEVRMGNTGTRYFTASSTAWEITGRTGSGEQVTIRRTSADLARQIGVGVVAPDRTRVFFVPTDTSLVEGSVQVHLAQ